MPDDTTEQGARRNAAEALLCPYCGSSDVNSAARDDQTDDVATCLTCEHEWRPRS